MNILVTGGAGYIGSVLGQILLKNNFNVTVLDNFLFKQKSLNQIKKNRQLNIVEGDVRDESIIKDLVTKSDIIIPLAALVGAPLCDIKPKEAKEVNLDSMFLLKSILSKNQRVIKVISFYRIFTMIISDYSIVYWCTKINFTFLSSLFHYLQPLFQTNFLSHYQVVLFH